MGVRSWGLEGWARAPGGLKLPEEKQPHCRRWLIEARQKLALLN